MMGCENTRTLAKKIKELAPDAVAEECAPSCGCHEPVKIQQPVLFEIKSPVTSACGCEDSSNDQNGKNRKKKVSTTPTVTAKKHGKNISQPHQRSLQKNTAKTSSWTRPVIS
jgi:hypothetical protein